MYFLKSPYNDKNKLEGHTLEVILSAEKFYNEEIEKIRLIEMARERASLSNLKNYMKDDEDLQFFLTTPIIKLPKNYRYLIVSVSQDIIVKGTLYDLIKHNFNKHMSYSEFSYTYKSVNGKRVKKLIGYCFYETTSNPMTAGKGAVTDIVLVSFTPEKNSYTLTKDMLELLEELRREYKSIDWTAFPDNPIVKSYNKIAKQNNGYSWLDTTYNPPLMHYRLMGKDTRNYKEGIEINGITYYSKEDFLNSLSPYWRQQYDESYYHSEKLIFE